MFSLLTKYLLFYKRVSIPDIGSFVIVQQPATLNFVDRQLLPPVYKIVFDEKVAEDDGLIHFIGADTDIEPGAARHKLAQFGSALKSKLQEAPFIWKGIGKLEYADGIVFHADTPAATLSPVAAHRIIRENSNHTVLVGEQEMQSTSIEAARQEPAVKKRQPANIIIGWLLLTAAAAFIVFYCYSQNNILQSTGLKMGIEKTTAPTSYK